MKTFKIVLSIILTTAVIFTGMLCLFEYFSNIDKYLSLKNIFFLVTSSLIFLPLYEFWLDFFKQTLDDIFKK